MQLECKISLFYWYLHNNACIDEIIEELQDRDPDLSDDDAEKLAENIYGVCYEIGFDMEYDPKTFDITNVKIRK